MKFLKDKIHLNLGYLEDDKDDLVEVYQRRNLLVHNGGLVNSTYTSNVSEKHKAAVTMEQSLVPSRAYILEAIQLVEKFFLLVAFDLWKKRLPEDATRGEALIEIGFNHMSANRWLIAEALSYFLKCDAMQTEEMRLIGQVNLWICKKRRGDFDSVKPEIERYDMSSKMAKFRIAKAALLCDATSVLELADQAIAAEELDEESFSTWPLFADLQADCMFQKRFSTTAIAAQESEAQGSESSRDS